jgi:hypothetical protein
MHIWQVSSCSRSRRPLVRGVGSGACAAAMGMVIVGMEVENALGVARSE